jgi:hypothetical protein
VHSLRLEMPAQLLNLLRHGQKHLGFLAANGGEKLFAADIDADGMGFNCPLAVPARRIFRSVNKTNLQPTKRDRQPPE